MDDTEHSETLEQLTLFGHLEHIEFHIGGRCPHCSAWAFYQSPSSTFEGVVIRECERHDCRRMFYFIYE